LLRGSWLVRAKAPRLAQEDDNGRHVHPQPLQLMSNGDGHTLSSAPRTAFGVFLFVGWAILTVIWVASTIDLAADGEVQPVITALVALALMALLAGMEGLEVAVIDRWRALYPDRAASHLAAWLAARQFFVAIIVTTATILSHRSELIIPFTSESISGPTLPKVFDIVWTGLTVLWFAQIFPKHLAATNPDRYLGFLRAPLFPVVEVVRKVGVSQPAEWVARAVEHRLAWPLTRAEEIEEAVIPREESLAGVWRELIPGTPPESGAPSPRNVAETR
jgi:hypothetical protein